MCNVAVRYKEVNSHLNDAASSLIEKAVKETDFRELPDRNPALALSVAEFGMVLRDSRFKGTASLSSAEAIAAACAQESGDPAIRSYAELVGTLKQQSR